MPRNNNNYPNTEAGARQAATDVIGIEGVEAVQAWRSGYKPNARWTVKLNKPIANRHGVVSDEYDLALRGGLNAFGKLEGWNYIETITYF